MLRNFTRRLIQKMTATRTKKPAKAAEPDVVDPADNVETDPIASRTRGGYDVDNYSQVSGTAAHTNQMCRIVSGDLQGVMGVMGQAVTTDDESGQPLTVEFTRARDERQGERFVLPYSILERAA